MIANASRLADAFRAAGAPVVLGGIATNYGVESTARDGYERGYQLVFVEDAMSARSAPRLRCAAPARPGGAVLKSASVKPA